MSDTLRRGSVAWAEVLDPYTGQPARRPVVVLAATRDIRPGSLVRVVVLSTDIAGTPPESAVELPSSPDGSTPTGLRMPCVAVCDWLELLPVAVIDTPSGSVPPAVLAAILAKVNPTA